jgi:hypothetical protein
LPPWIRKGLEFDYERPGEKHDGPWRVKAQDFDIDEDGVRAVASRLQKRPNISTVDVEMRHGRKGSLIGAQSPERRPARVLGDTAYGNEPVRTELAERGVNVPAPGPEGKVAEDRAASASSRSSWTPAGHIPGRSDGAGQHLQEGVTQRELLPADLAAV